MSTRISFSGWVSIVPTKMVNNWVKIHLIPDKKVLDFKKVNDDLGEVSDDIVYELSLFKDGLFTDHQYTFLPDKVKSLKKSGYEVTNISRALTSDIYDTMDKEVSAWYKQVFNYVEDWLTIKGYLKVKQGTFKTGFCVESNPNCETVQNWGAPLADKGNKIIQIKEKFGEIRVYFTSLTDQEEKEINKFAKEVQKKFDCSCSFG